MELTTPSSSVVKATSDPLFIPASEGKVEAKISSSPTTTATPRKSILLSYERNRRHSVNGGPSPFVILHVEDTSFHWEMVEGVIKRLNQKEPRPKILYTHFPSGEEAYKYFEEHTVDVVLMDINLSGGGGKWDGYDTARKIIKLSSDQLIFSASSDNVVNNPIIEGRPMFSKHLGKSGIVQFIREDLEGVVLAARLKRLEEDPPK